MNIPRLCARHPVSVLMIYAAFILTGVISISKLEINLYPEINIPVASVITDCEGLPDKDIETMITSPLENALSSVKGIKEISSVSKEGISSVTLKFGWEADINRTGAEIREKIDTVYPILPANSKKPLLIFKDLSDSPLLTIALTPSKGKSISDISGIVETELKSRILSIKGVSEVNISGISEKEIKIDVDYPSLINTGLSLNEFSETVASSVFSFPAGKVYEGIHEYRVTAETDIKNIRDLKNIPLPGRGGLKTGDIADIYEGEKEKSSWFHADAKPCIGLEIIKSGNSGMLNVSQRLKESLDILKDLFKNDFTIQIIEDSSIPLQNSLKELLLAIAAGIISASLVLVYIFRNRKISLIVISSLPSSMFMVFTFMFFAGISINIISLLALVIGIGMVFDNTIVVLEKLLDKKPLSWEETGDIVSGTVLSVSGSTATTILIFLPLLFVSGIAGKLFRDLAVTVIAFITVSAFAAMTITPALYILMNIQKENTAERGKLIKYLKSVYIKYLGIGGKNILFLTILFLLPLFLLLPVEKETIPSGSDKKITAVVTFPPGLLLSEYSDKASVIEKILLASEWIEKVHVKGGVEAKSPVDRGSENKSINKAFFFISGKKKFSGDTDDFRTSVSSLFSSLDVDAEIKRNDSFLDKLTDKNQQTRILITSDEREKAGEAAREISSLLLEKGLAEKISGNHLKDNPGYTIRFLKDGLSETGITASDMGMILLNAVRGSVAASLDTGEERDTDIRIRYKKEYTDSPDKIIALKTPVEGGLLDSSSLAAVEFKKNYQSLTRHNRKPSFILNISRLPGKEKEMKFFFDNYIKNSVEIKSDALSSETYSETGWLFLFAVLLVYLILGAQFESFIIPLFLMFTIPLSVSGSLLLLFISGSSLNISSFLGILILTGTTVNTAILLFAEVKGEGSTIKEGAEKRFIPIIATLATTVTALLPAAFSKGSPLQSCASLSLIGGLLAGGVSVFLLFPFIFRNISLKQENKIGSL